MQEEESSADGYAEAGQRAAGDPAVAFEALRAEVARLGAMIEALQADLIEHRGPDVTPTLAQLAKAQNIAAQHLGVIQQHPALRMTPADHGEAIKRAGTAAMGDAVRGFWEASAAVRDHAQQLGTVIGTARERDRQWRWLIWTGSAAFLLGLLASPILVRLLPFGLDTRVAASVLATDRWNAGATLMATENPDAWRELQAAGEILRINHAAIDQCRDAAAKTKKPQRCIISISMPE